MREAAEDARRQVLAIAADEFEADPEDLEIVDGEVRVKGTPTRTIPIGDVAAKGMGFGANHAPVLGQGRTTVTDQSPAFSVQLVEVDVDRETGEVQVLRHVIAQDAGRAINPLAVEGQMIGGAVQGLGWALYEEMAYDEEGQLLSGSWMDYTMPDTMQTAPEMEAIIVEVALGARPLWRARGRGASRRPDAGGRRQRHRPQHGPAPEGPADDGAARAAGAALAERRLSAVSQAQP